MKKANKIKICVLALSIILLLSLGSCNLAPTKQAPEADILENGDLVANMLGLQNAEGTAYDVDFFVGNGKNVRSIRTALIEKEPETVLAYHDFGGWYDNGEYEGRRIVFPYTVTKNMTLYAKWYKQYSVTFEANGGKSSNSKEMESIRAGYIEKTPITIREGFNFEGWFTTEDFEVSSRVSFPYEVTGDVIFYAKWVTAGAYQISTVEELLNIRYGLDAANVYTLANDIDFNTPLGKMEIEPIGTKELPFKGTLNGNGKTISNFAISTTGDFEKYYGLFGATKEASIKNLTIKDVNIYLDSNFMFYAGGIVGYMEKGTMENCTVINADFIGDGKEVHLGAIAGYLDGQSEANRSQEGVIADSRSLGGNIRSLSAEKNISVGGIVGTIFAGIVRDSYSTANIAGSTAGGIAGTNKGDVRKKGEYKNEDSDDIYEQDTLIKASIIENCYFEGDVQQPKGYSTVVKNTPITDYPTVIGGIVGSNLTGGTVTRCRSMATIKGRHAGGIVGINGELLFSNNAIAAQITHSYSTSIVNSDYRAGGIAGHNEKATISNCFNRGIVEANAVPIKNERGDSVGGTTSNVYAGGIVGYNWEGTINNCLNYNSIVATSIMPGANEQNPQLGDFVPAFAGLIVGFSSNKITTGYSSEGLTVTRNREPYTLYEDNIFFVVEVRQNNTYIIVPDDVSTPTAEAFFNRIGYSSTIWNIVVDGTTITLSLR